jgi:hypothetical protein
MQPATGAEWGSRESGPCPGFGVGVGVSGGKAGAILSSTTADNTAFAEKHGAVEASSLMRNPPTPALNGNPARLVSYTITTAVPLTTVNRRSAGAQTVVSVLTGLVHTGGSPVAGRPKAKTLRVIPPSHPADTPLAMHASAKLTPSGLSTGWTLGAPAQSRGSRQIATAPLPDPKVTRTPKC